MSYTFELLGITPILDFFNHQQTLISDPYSLRAEYLGVHQCKLDRILKELQSVPTERNWDLDTVSQVVVDYWIGRAKTIRYWSDRLEDAGSSCLLIARISDVHSLRHEFERTFLR